MMKLHVSFVRRLLAIGACVALLFLAFLAESDPTRSYFVEGRALASRGRRRLQQTAEAVGDDDDVVDADGKSSGKGSGGSGSGGGGCGEGGCTCKADLVDFLEVITLNEKFQALNETVATQKDDIKTQKDDIKTLTELVQNLTRRVDEQHPPTAAPSLQPSGSPSESQSGEICFNLEDFANATLALDALECLEEYDEPDASDCISCLSTGPINGTDGADCRSPFTDGEPGEDGRCGGRGGRGGDGCVEVVMEATEEEAVMAVLVEEMPMVEGEVTGAPGESQKIIMEATEVTEVMGGMEVVMMEMVAQGEQGGQEPLEAALVLMGPWEFRPLDRDIPYTTANLIASLWLILSLDSGHFATNKDS